MGKYFAREIFVNIWNYKTEHKMDLINLRKKEGEEGSWEGRRKADITLTCKYKINTTEGVIKDNSDQSHNPEK